MKNIKEIAYEKYKLDWMIGHGHSIKDIFSECKQIFVEMTIDGDIDSDANVAADEVKDVFMESGFNGELWASYGEFLDNEFMMRSYMKRLLNCGEYKLYLKELKNNDET